MNRRFSGNPDPASRRGAKAKKPAIPRALKKRARALEQDLACNPPQLPLLPERNPVAELIDTWMPIIGRLATEAKERELAKWDEIERIEAERPPPPPLRPGDRVRYTASALRSMYGVDIWGACDAPDEAWTLVECTCELCAGGSFVRFDDGRHAALAALERHPLTQAEPTEAESEAFLEWERKNLKIDRVRGTCVKLGER